MNEFEDKLKRYIKENNIDCQHLSFEKSTHSVEEAAQTANVSKDSFIKNICMIDDNNNLIVAIVTADSRASTSRVAKALEINRPRVATIEEILEKTGYPCGGTPSFGYNALFLIDPKVLERETIYSGGGSPKSLVKINTKELQKTNNGKIVRVRK